MPKSKSTDDPQSVESQLEARVDAMMDTRAEPAKAAPPKDAGQPLPPLDIFAGSAPGAPTLPKKPTAARDVNHDGIADKPASPPAAEPLPAEAEALPPAADDVTPDPLNIDSPDTEAAIADIVAQEADAVLAAEDAGLAAAYQPPEEPAEQPAKKGHPFFWFMIALLCAVAAIAAVMLLRPEWLPV